MADKHSFDISSKIELQELDNAINQALREINNRYDLKDTNTTIEYDGKTHQIKLESAGDYQLKAAKEIFHQNLVKRNISVKALDYSDPEKASGDRLRQSTAVQQGIPQDKAKQVTKLIKDTGLKVQAQIMGDSIRVTGKKIDDLQAVMKACREKKFDFHLAFKNLK
ncbi:YajQ family cyclic di-GMP-binding protein [Candidatus Marinamargulisbacteria bacterium SCGC AG-414-C22]|nr:YajQ family cyclic di-GMP-binding protein [Candidatus Marinamargulisbacteria bacterium SCGC AG-414-C22]